MQIHEITIQESLAGELLKGVGRAARDQFIQRATGVSDPYEKTDMTGYVDPAALATTALPSTVPVVPSSRAAGAKSRAAAAVKKGRAAPITKPAAPVVYQFDRRPLNPASPGDAAIIKILQAAGVTSATST